MAEKVRTIPLDEFAHNIAAVFERVVRGQETVLVENGKGEVIMLKPAPSNASSTARHPRQLAAAEGAFLATAGGWDGLVDTDKLVEDIYESRRTSLPPLKS